MYDSFSRATRSKILDASAQEEMQTKEKVRAKMHRNGKTKAKAEVEATHTRGRTKAEDAGLLARTGLSRSLASSHLWHHKLDVF